MATRPKGRLVEEMELRLANNRARFSRNGVPSGGRVTSLNNGDHGSPPIYDDILPPDHVTGGSNGDNDYSRAPRRSGGSGRSRQSAQSGRSNRSGQPRRLGSLCGDSGDSFEDCERIYADIADLDSVTPESDTVAAPAANAAEPYLPTTTTPLPPPPSRLALNWLFCVARAGFFFLICRKLFSIGAMFLDLSMDYWLAYK